MLKVFIRSQAMGNEADNELNTYKHMATVSSKSKHPGRDAVRSLLDNFKVAGPDGEHHCLVHPPLWESINRFLTRNPVGRLPPPVLGIVLQRLFLALDFMHTECQLVHTGEPPPPASRQRIALLTISRPEDGQHPVRHRG